MGEKQRGDNNHGSGALAWSSGLLAALVATLLPLLGGLAAGWPPARAATYTALALVYLALIGLADASNAWGRLCWRHPALYLSACGALCAALTAISGDGFVQPIAFTVPFVSALFLYRLPRAALVGAGYLGLLAIGLWAGGPSGPGGLIAPVAVYAALFVFMSAFVRLALDQRAARERADALARDLARERDAMAALAAENARLAAENAAAATLAERNRIARELHDTIAQGLTATAMQIEAAQRALDRDPERARARLARANELARDTLADVRRSVWALAAPDLAGDDLGAALADQARRFGERSGLAADYAHSGPPLDLPSEGAVQVLRIVQEALLNVEKHAGASRVQVRSCSDAAGLQVWVGDDGRGFDPAAPPASAAGGGFGLISLRERARLAGGALEVASAPGAGARVSVRLPAAPPDEVADHG